jgi:AcrR family transcriptional regulator
VTVQAKRQRRADARRSIAAIVDAARSALASDPKVSMSEMARLAGVGRVTLYTHFPSREALIDAVVEQVMGETAEALDALALDADPADQALGRLVRASWRHLDESRRIRVAAVAELGPQRLLEHHRAPDAWPERLISRGRAERVFRTDLPMDWMVATFYGLMHAAADEVDAGRLDADRAPELLEATLRAALAGR